MCGALTGAARSESLRDPARAAGAPRTQVESAVRTALHRREELKGTSSTTGSASPGRWAARAVLVRFAAPALRAIDPNAAATGSASCPSTGAVSTTVRRPVVSVPVLSVQTTSTLLTDSTALTSCTSAPRREAVTHQRCRRAR